MFKRLVLILITFLTFNSHSKVEFVRAMFRINASNSITIAWNQVSGKNPELHIETNKEKLSSSTTKVLVTKKNHAKFLHNHFVRLENLKPATTYYFMIKDSEETSRVYYFTTISDNNNTKISLIAGGDSRDNRKVRTKGNLMVAKLKPDAVLFNGDFTGIDIPSQWRDWFEDWEKSISSDGRISPLIVTRGNHEHTNKVLVDLFDVPHKKVYYNTVLGGDLLNIVSLNSEILKIFGQKKFLKSTLKKHRNFTYQIPQYHRPIRPHVGHKKEMETQYKNFVPLFEKYPNVVLCLENDSHTCKITWPIVSSKAEGSSEGFIRDDKNGIVYAGEGCWGAPQRKADDLKPWTRDAEAVNQFNWIFVTKEKIELRTVLYENSEDIEELSNNNRFIIPKNLNLWGPTNGTLVEIFPRK
jgi:acid phosphatase type 7